MIAQAEEWFRERDWNVFPYQKKAWKSFLAGEEGLIVAPTGTGKTYAALFGPFLEAGAEAAGPVILWLTPLRALANDLSQAISLPLSQLAPQWRVEVRTGDTSQQKKAKQRTSLPHILITTPESLALLLTYRDTHAQLSRLQALIVDEWHELLGNKRGTLLELSVSRLRSIAPTMRTWGVSASLGNIPQAAKVLLPQTRSGKEPTIIRCDFEKKYRIESIIPERMERFPWSGHLGLKVLPQIVREVKQAKTSLLFTNTRSQAEIWHAQLQERMPEEKIVLHHGSLERGIREEAERLIKAGEVRLAVCTSSLDLGVDFPPVEQVFQLGSPKGVARFLQRLGRSGHSPFEESRMICVPTNAFELLEFSATRRALKEKKIESRVPLESCFDVLIQHILSSSLSGFRGQELFEEVRSTYAFRNLSEKDWQWCLLFAASGGETLKAYGQFQRLLEKDGVYTIRDKKAERFHRLSIGTILSDSMASVKYARGPTLGQVEESFLAKLKPGDSFLFAGKVLTLIQFRDLKAYVRKAKEKASIIPRWMGGRLPLSTHLAQYVEDEFSHPSHSAEMKALSSILQTQADISGLPRKNSLLIEQVKIRTQYHLFLYPFAGYHVHEGLSSLLSLRISRLLPISLSAVVNDYGIHIVSSKEIPLDENSLDLLFSAEGLESAMAEAANIAELGKRQFREVARIAGLIFQGYPGAPKTNKQLQVSSGLLYDVFAKYEPGNLLLAQANAEALERIFQLDVLQAVLREIGSQEKNIHRLKTLSPLSFPLWASFQQTHMSSESWQEKIDRMLEEIDKKNSEPKKRTRNNTGR